jgi:hypothetical protein
LKTCCMIGCTAKHYGKGYCKKHHQWQWKRGLLPPPPTLAERIRANMLIDANGCWLWQGSRNNKGYGKLSHGGETYAHRHSFSLAKGPIPEGMEVCHRCDTPACVNPDHLFLGTHIENMRDSVRKGRARQWRASGFASSRAKLTPEQVEHIRTSTELGYVIAERLGVNKLTVYRCRNGETYK